MKVLVLASWPWMPGALSLGDQQVFRRIERLADRHEITLACLDWGDMATSPRGPLRLVRLDAEMLLSRAVTRLQRRLESTCGLAPRSPALVAAIDDLVRERRPDVVHLLGNEMLAHRPATTVPMVADFLDLGSRFVANREVRGTWDKVRRTVRSRHLERLERETLAVARAVMFVSPVERELVSAWPGAAERIWIPTATDTTFFRPEISDAEGEPLLLFAGRMDYAPNVDAATFLCSDILPELRRRGVRARVIIAGHNPSPEVRRLEGPDIEVTGSVPDMRPYWRKAAVVVVPLRWGTGTRNKIVEAWAMGKAVVTTPLGGEGLLGKDGEHFLAASQAGEFAIRVAQVLADEGLRRRLGEAGRGLAETHYSLESAAQSLDRVYHSAVGPS